MYLEQHRTWIRLQHNHWFLGKRLGHKLLYSPCALWIGGLALRVSLVSSMKLVCRKWRVNFRLCWIFLNRLALLLQWSACERGQLLISHNRIWNCRSRFSQLWASTSEHLVVFVQPLQTLNLLKTLVVRLSSLIFIHVACWYEDHPSENSTISSPFPFCLVVEFPLGFSRLIFSWNFLLLLKNN